VAGAACGNSPQPAARLRAQVIRPPRDTVRFDTPASAGRCDRAGSGAGRGVLIRGTQGGNGVLIWLRPGDSLAPGDFPLLERADSVAARGAVVAVRFMLGEVAHGLWVDSGAVSVSRRADRLTVTARGTGPELGTSGRVTLAASFESVALGSDTVSCQVRP
jgi:hypothetical protein